MGRRRVSMTPDRKGGHKPLIVGNDPHFSLGHGDSRQISRGPQTILAAASLVFQRNPFGVAKERKAGLQVGAKGRMSLPLVRPFQTRIQSGKGPVGWPVFGSWHPFCLMSFSGKPKPILQGPIPKDEGNPFPFPKLKLFPGGAPSRPKDGQLHEWFAGICLRWGSNRSWAS